MLTDQYSAKSSLSPPHDKVLYANWPQCLKVFPIEKCGKPTRSGRFVSMINLSRMDEFTITFDLFALKSVQTELYQLLTNPTVYLITWDSNAEYLALTNTREPLSAMRIVVDVSKIWDTF